MKYAILILFFMAQVHADDDTQQDLLQGLTRQMVQPYQAPQLPSGPYDTSLFNNGPYGNMGCSGLKPLTSMNCHAVCINGSWSEICN